MDKQTKIMIFGPIIIFIEAALTVYFMGWIIMLKVFVTTVLVSAIAAIPIVWLFREEENDGRKSNDI